MSAKEALAKKGQNAGDKSIKQLIVSMKSQIEAALPKVMTEERFTRIALTCIANNPKLQECEGRSFLGAMMNAAQLGLEPNTPLGQAYLIPFKNNKLGITECQFQIGYKGLIDLAHRSGEFQSIYAHVVHENDFFEYELGLEPKLIHKPAATDRGNAIFYYAVYRLKNGGFGFEVMSVEDVKNHKAKYSKAGGFSPWNDNFDEMAKKTVIKKVLKYAPIKVEFLRQIAEDSTIKSEISTDMGLVEDELPEIVYDEDDEQVSE